MAHIEVLVITGLTGAGKTSLVGALLRSLPSESRCAICVHRHALAFSLETTVLELQEGQCVHYSEVYDFGSGCLCCAPDGDVSRLLTELAAKRHELRLSHLFIETTGVADPQPFVSLFGDDRCSASHKANFQLKGVVAVADLVHTPLLLGPDSQAQHSSIAARGAAQLRAADVLVLSKHDELLARGGGSDEVAGVCRLVTSLARPEARGAADDTEEPNLAEPVICFDDAETAAVSYQRIDAAIQRLEGRLRHAALFGSCMAPRAMALPTLAIAFGPGARHDASCETVCLVLPRGGVRLDAALAMLQALLDGGDALRIQGYLSFLPTALEAHTGVEAKDGSDIGSERSACSFPPAVERLWAMPMVTVEGHYRSRLRVRAICSAEASGATSQAAESAGLPWQDHAAQAGAGDRGACKVFICGKNVDDHTLKAQLGTTAGLGFQGPLCDLEQLTPKAVQAMALLSSAVAEALDKGAGRAAGISSSIAASSSGDSTAAQDQVLGERGDSVWQVPCIAQERAKAESFSQVLGASLRAALASRQGGGEGAADTSHAEAATLEVALRLPARRGCAEQAATLRWAAGTVSVRRIPATAAPLGSLSMDPRAGLRFCVQGTGRQSDQLQEKENDLEVLVVGSQVYARARR